jgi:hypothetical protein
VLAVAANTTSAIVAGVEQIGKQLDLVGELS